MFGKYTQGVFRNIKDTEDYSLLNRACRADGRDGFNLDQTQSLKISIKKSHIRVITFFVLLRIYIMRGQIYDI